VDTLLVASSGVQDDAVSSDDVGSLLTIIIIINRHDRIAIRRARWFTTSALHCSTDPAAHYRVPSERVQVRRLADAWIFLLHVCQPRSALSLRIARMDIDPWKCLHLVPW